MIRNIFKAIAGFFKSKNTPVKTAEYEVLEYTPKSALKAAKRTRKPKMRAHDYTMR